MITKISKAETIRTKLRKAGNVTILDEPKHIAAIVAMNENLEVVRREYRAKDRNSQNAAAMVYLTD